MENVTSFGFLLGRLFLAQIFLMSGVSKIFNFSATTQYMSSHGIHPVGLWIVVAIVVELTGSASLIAGYFTRIGALLLLCFLLPVTLIFHLDLGDRMQAVMFMKNTAILGGLIMVLCTGAGKFSMDEKKRRDRVG